MKVVGVSPAEGLHFKLVASDKGGTATSPDQATALASFAVTAQSGMPTSQTQATLSATTTLPTGTAYHWVYWVEAPVGN